MHFTDGSWLWRLLSLENYLMQWVSLEKYWWDWVLRKNTKWCCCLTQVPWRGNQKCELVPDLVIAEKMGWLFCCFMWNFSMAFSPKLILSDCLENHGRFSFSTRNRLINGLEQFEVRECGVKTLKWKNNFLLKKYLKQQQIGFWANLWRVI